MFAEPGEHRGIIVGNAYEELLRWYQVRSHSLFDSCSHSPSMTLPLSPIHTFPPSSTSITTLSLNILTLLPYLVQTATPDPVYRARVLKCEATHASAIMEGLEALGFYEKEVEVF
jgi:hypothetical protein